jgi:dihydrofolate reductase
VARTQYYTATSIDGFIADDRNSLDWLFQVGAGEAGTNGAAGDRFSRFFAGVGAMAMGATTYEWVLEHEKELLTDPARWRSYYGEVPCWVFTHRRLPPVPGASIVMTQDDIETVHAQMTSAAGGRNIWLAGGGDLAGQFADRGLLDEIQLGIAPVLLGAGAPLLPRRILSARLSLAAVEHDGHFAYLTYRVAPPLATHPAG